jgi:hypothetical protein
MTKATKECRNIKNKIYQNKLQILKSFILSKANPMYSKAQDQDSSCLISVFKILIKAKKVHKPQKRRIKNHKTHKSLSISECILSLGKETKLASSLQEITLKISQV